MVKRPLPASPLTLPPRAPRPGAGEADRLLRPQPPRPIPPRVPASQPAGLLAHTLLGHRVVK